MLSMKLPESFYQQPDVLATAQQILGKYLCTNIDGQFTSGIIVEAEAYSHTERASHSYGNRRTKRTEIMFHAGGFAYVYLCYGIHHLFNIVTGPEGDAQAVLIRAIQPVDGIETILGRRKMQRLSPRAGAGPGVVSSALGIGTQHYGQPLTGGVIWLEDRGITYPDANIIRSPRVGVDYAGEDALLPWRLRVKGNPYTSLPR